MIHGFTRSRRARPSAFNVGGRAVAGDLAEYRTRGETGAAGVVMIENAAHQFARRIQPRYRFARGVLDCAVVGNFQAAERERHAARYTIGFERRLFDGVRPVGLVDPEAFGAAAILDCGVVRDVGANGLVIRLEFAQARVRIDAVELFDEFLERVGAHLGHALDAVLVAQRRDDLVVEDLPREHARLRVDHRAVLGVGVIGEVRALVDETLAARVHHDAPRIAVFLEAVTDREIAERRRVEVPAYRMAARPVAVGHRADIERHLDAESRVVARAAHLGEIPVRAEIARAHFCARLEAAARNHHRPGADIDVSAPLLRPDAALRAVVIRHQRHRRGFVENRDAFARARLVLVFHQALAATPRFRGESAPEFVPVADLVRLAAEACPEYHPLLSHPHH